MGDDIFKAIDLSKKYGNFFALEKVNMRIRSGEIYGLIGENGAGKTTLMKIIGNLARPTSGSIALFGETNTANMNKVRKQMGYLIEMPALYPELSARDNLEFYCRILNITDKDAIKKTLKRVALEDTGDKKVEKFSLGMRQRLGLAIALINEPKFLVLDEPVNGLDPSGITLIREVLIDLAREKGVAVLISSHILSELQLLATRFGFIHKGRMLQEISAEDLANTDDKYICIKTYNSSIASQILQDTFQIQMIHDEHNGEIRIPSQIKLEAIVATLIRHDLPIESISISSPTLENYYMNLIRRRNR